MRDSRVVRSHPLCHRDRKVINTLPWVHCAAESSRDGWSASASAIGDFASTPENLGYEDGRPINYTKEEDTPPHL